jgi:hypothetical protein
MGCLRTGQPLRASGPPFRRNRRTTPGLLLRLAGDPQQELGAVFPIGGPAALCLRGVLPHTGPVTTAFCAGHEPLIEKGHR